MDDQEVLTLAADRLVRVYGESENTEYVRRLRAIAHTLTPGKETDFAETTQQAVSRLISKIGLDEGHPCEMAGCTARVEFDDEPYCFEHSPDEGSHFPGYSYKDGIKYMLDPNKV